MNNKVKFLRGTSNEYAVAEKDSDTIYFTTDDGKLYIGDKEVSGSDITIDDTLSDTSENPVQNKVIKQALDLKADKTTATTDTDGLMSAEDKSKLDAFEITTDGGKLHDKDIATTDLIPTELPANGGNADTVDNVHISCTNDATANSNWFAVFTDNNNLRAIDPGRAYIGNAGLLKPTLIGTAEHCAYHTILDWANSVNGMGQAVIVQGSGFPSDTPVGDEGMLTVETDFENKRKVVTFKSYGSGHGTYRRNIWSGEWRWGWVDIADADTVDGLHADDFVNATNRDNNQIPNNADAPAWIHANGKRYKIYMTNGANKGMTNIPDNSTDYVWYWYDGVNIIAREWATGKYYICDVINGGFSGWKDVYTSGYKPYVTGDVPISEDGKCYTNHGFTPSVILYNLPYTTATLFDNVQKATTFDTTSFTPPFGSNWGDY